MVSRQSSIQNSFRLLHSDNSLFLSDSSIQGLLLMIDEQIANRQASIQKSLEMLHSNDSSCKNESSIHHSPFTIDDSSLTIHQQIPNLFL
jgi:hypothetical protein